MTPCLPGISGFTDETMTSAAIVDKTPIPEPFPLDDKGLFKMSWDRLEPPGGRHQNPLKQTGPGDLPEVWINPF